LGSVVPGGGAAAAAQGAGRAPAPAERGASGEVILDQAALVADTLPHHPPHDEAVGVARPHGHRSWATPNMGTQSHDDDSNNH